MFFFPKNAGWCGEIRKVVFSTDTESVTVVYRITVRGTDGEVIFCSTNYHEVK